MPTSRGTFDRGRAGAFVQGRTGDRNRTGDPDVLSIILYDEVESGCEPITGYRTGPGCPEDGPQAWDEDVVLHDAFRETRTTQVAIVNRAFTDGSFRPNRPSGKLLPAGVTEFRVGFRPSVTQLIAVYDAMRPLMEKPFLVIVSHASESTGITDLIGFRPAMTAFIDYLGEQIETDDMLSRVRPYVDFFDGLFERWLRITPRRVMANV